MGRQRTIMRFSKNEIEELKSYSALNSKILEVSKSSSNEDVGEYIEAQFNMAVSIVNKICKELEIKSFVD